jgi:hypothetical protein
MTPFRKEYLQLVQRHPPVWDSELEVAVEAKEEI